MEYVEKLEEMTGKKFGDLYNPLLVSVRSGARASMPGMMDTILNLGLNDEVVVAFAKKTNNPRFAYDSYRRFIQMYSDVVMEVGKKYFEQLIDEMKDKKGVKLDTELDADDLKELGDTMRLFTFDLLGLKDDAAEGNASREKAYGKVMEMVLRLRQQAKEAKDWATSDQIRDALNDAGFVINDTKDGTTWSL